MSVRSLLRFPLIKTVVRMCQRGTRGASLCAECLCSLPYTLLGSPQEFVRVAILRGFHDSVDDDEFEVGRGQPFGFQQEVSQVLVAAAAVDQ